MKTKIKCTLYKLPFVFAISFLLLFECPILFAQSPGGISPGLTLWLKAGSGTTTTGVNLTGWADQSTLSTVVTVNGSPDYVANGYNFNPYINFTMSGATGGDFLHTPDINLRTFFWVAELNDLTRKSTHLATYDGVTLSAPCGGCPLHGGENGGAVAQYMELGYANATFQSAGVWRQNGIATGIAYNTAHSGNYDIVSALGGSAVPTNVFMGGQNSNGIWFDGRVRDWIGPVGEIISYSGAITAVEANKIETYLAVKYGITLGGNGSTTLSYTSPNGTIIWGANTGYHYDIAGIGNDVVIEGLDQPKSHSINSPADAVTMANNNFTTPTSMSNGDYLLWGHNNSALTYTCQNFTQASPSTVISALWGRTWRTQKTGTPTGNVIIEIDMNLMQGPTGLGTATNADVRLLLDDNTTFGDVSGGEHNYSPTIGYTATGGKIYFSVPYADIQSGQGFFGLGLASPLPIANAGSDIPTCSGIAGSIGTTTTSGFTYSWNPTTGLNFSTVSNPSITLTNVTASPVTSTYTVTTTVTATGCAATDNVDITVSPIDNAGFTTTPTCTGGTATITGTVGGIFTFNVAPSDAAVINAGTGTITGGTSGTTYNITYTTAGACPASSNGTVTALTQDAATFTTTPTCTGGTASITGTTGGTFTFNIAPSDAAIINAGTGTVSGGTSGTTYNITYTTAGACPASSNGTVTASSSDIATFTTTPTCTGGTATINGTTGGTFTFNIAPSDAATLNASTGSITNGTSGTTYNITYTTAGACSVSSNGTITALTQDVATFTTTPTCTGGTATITGTTGGTFTFTTPAGGASINATSGTVTGGISGTTYNITYTTAGACPASSNGTVTVLIQDIATFTTTPTCTGGTATITGTAGGTFTFNIAPSDAATINSATGTITGGASGTTYNITYITSGTCPTSSNGTVTVFTSPILTTTGLDHTYCSSETISDLFITPTQGGTITWYSDANLSTTIAINDSLTPDNIIGISNYYVTETANGCEGPANQIIIVINSCEVEIPTAFTPDADNMNDSWEIEDIDTTFPNNIVRVYNRWGNLLFESSQGTYETNPWRGSYKDEILPVGSYYYQIEYNDSTKKVSTGTVTIIRK